MTEAQYREEIARLTAANAALKEKQNRGIHYAVSEKGAVSIKGIRRFPITQYKEQWFRFLNMKDQLRQFIKDNQAEIARKQAARTDRPTRR